MNLGRIVKDVDKFIKFHINFIYIFNYRINQNFFILSSNKKYNLYKLGLGEVRCGA